MASERLEWGDGDRDDDPQRAVSAEETRPAPAKKWIREGNFWIDEHGIRHLRRADGSVHRWRAEGAVPDREVTDLPTL